ncbi:MAG TPA: hypothetical protein PKE45_00885, partial [Caldilineaceae bacterium]|nr:hypothetical protein [Caldilineaceae bacterium]
MNNTMERFPSFDMLQSEHDDLLDQQVQRGETGDQVSAAFQSEVAQFIVRAQATGALLDTSHDRRAAQSILDYWANVLYRARYQPPEAR